MEAKVPVALTPLGRSKGREAGSGDPGQRGFHGSPIRLLLRRGDWVLPGKEDCTLPPGVGGKAQEDETSVSG